MGAVVLEAILVARDHDRLSTVRPADAPNMHVAWEEDLHPNESVIDAVAAAGFAPLLVHSTSWRMSSERLILSFVVVLEAGSTTPDGFVREPVERAELARGHAMAPPSQVETEHVVEHGLRHLAWLLEDDVTIAAALEDWGSALEGYVGEPFRSLG